MPDWLPIVIAVLGGGLLTGLGTILRGHGQTRNEQAKLASDDRAAWMTYQGAQIETLIKRNETVEARLNAQIEKQAAHSAAHSAEITELQRQNREQADQMIQLRDQNAQQAQQIATLTDERQQYIEKLAIVQARATWLEAALNVEREDNRRLREQLPPRIEVQEATP